MRGDLMLGFSERGSNASRVHAQPNVDTIHNLDGELTSTVLPGISVLDRTELGSLKLHDEHDWDYIRVIERISSTVFSFFCVRVDIGKQLVAVAPLFRLEYRIDDALGEWAKPGANWLARRLPGLVKVPALIMGNPFLDECPIGIPAHLSIRERCSYFGAFLDAMSDSTKKNGTGILAIKDIADRDAAWAHEVLTKRGFSRIPSLPVAELPVRFGSLDEYFAGLSSKVRADLRRKLRRSKAIRSEVRDTIDGLEEKIIDLYRQTQARRKADYPGFDEVPAELFREVLEGSHGKAHLRLCWLEDELVCFNIFIHSGDKIIGKYLGMNYSFVREHNLYFVNWLAMVQYAIANGVKSIQVGQTAYGVKVKLGCEIHPSWVYFKHTGKIRGPLFRLFAPLASYAQSDPDLGRLNQRSPNKP